MNQINIIDCNFKSLIHTRNTLIKAGYRRQISLFEDLFYGIEDSFFRNRELELVLISLQSVKRRRKELMELVNDFRATGRALPKLVFYNNKIDQSYLNQSWQLKEIGMMIPGLITVKSAEKILQFASSKSIKHSGQQDAVPDEEASIF